MGFFLGGLGGGGGGERDRQTDPISLRQSESVCVSVFWKLSVFLHVYIVLVHCRPIHFYNPPLPPTRCTYDTVQRRELVFFRGV